jgi:hypothetical protein
MKQLIEDLISAMEYHVEQTRPIHSTTVALQAAKEALKAQPTPVQEPVGEWIGSRSKDSDPKRISWKPGYVMSAKVGDKIYTTPPAQPAVQEPVAFEVGLVEWVGNKLMATPKTTTTPPASWMEMVTANLVREGVNKHKARELAEHFYTTPPAAPVQPAPEQQQPVAVVEIAVSPRRSIVVTHIPGTPFPRVGDFVYIKPERGTPT